MLGPTPKYLRSEKLVLALKAKYESQKLTAEANLDALAQDYVQIGEHSDLVSEMDKYITQITDANDKLTTLKEFFKELNIG